MSYFTGSISVESCDDREQCDTGLPSAVHLQRVKRMSCLVNNMILSAGVLTG